MRAVGYKEKGPVSVADALVDFELPEPVPGPRDLLVEVKGVSVNPVDIKVRARFEPEDTPRILGFDAAGVVKAVGSAVEGFAPGDEVFYAGDLNRPGSNAECQLVDERIVGRKPASLGFAEAAGHPLTSITAWEMLFDCFGLREGEGAGDALLVVGGAGGVGSILIQLAKQLTGLKVIATASRPDTQAWVKKMGADEVVNHHQPLDQELASLGVAPRYVAALTHTDRHFAAITEAIAPRGHIALIDDPPELNILPLKPKAVSVSWEFMFTRPMFATADISVQQALLNRVAALLDAGQLQSIVQRQDGALNASRLQAAHEFQASGTAIGKTVLDGLSA
ncbi:MAG: zinc-binding alcohol dehydrogenase family protein [Pseudomonadota bacterium]